MSHRAGTDGHRATTASETAVALEVRGVRKSFGERPVLAGVDVSVPAAGCVAVLGPSGSGKSTLLRCVAGLVQPDAGTIAVGGATTDGPGVCVPPERRGIAFLFQELALWPHMTVRGNLDFVLEARGVARADRAGHADVAARAAEFPAALLDRRPGDISGGERQRAALARVLAQEPRLLLLDEPLSHLDPHLRDALLIEIRRLRTARGLAALLVTHDLREAFTLADTVIVLRAGAVEQTGTPREVYGRPRTRFVAENLGRASFLATARGDGTLTTAVGVFPAADAPDGPVVAVVRPECVRPAPGGPIAGRVADSIYLGDHWIWDVRLGGGTPGNTREGERVVIRADRPAAREEEVRLAADRPSFVPDEHPREEIR